MTAPAALLRTSAGDFTLQEYRLGLGGREWSVLHTDAARVIATDAFARGAVAGGRP